MKDIECTIYTYYGVLGHEPCPSYRVSKISDLSATCDRDGEFYVG